MAGLESVFKLTKEIAVQAEEEGVSLNTLIISLIAQNFGKLVSQQKALVQFCRVCWFKQGRN